jgi:beta-1,4-mannosyltransferase
VGSGMSRFPSGSRVAVVALGDLARSPRALNHALSLAEEGHQVDLVGYLDTPLPAIVASSESVRVWRISGHPTRRETARKSIPSLLWRGVRLAWELSNALLRRVPSPDVVFVQTPPGTPTLPIALVAARLRGARFVVDWHNLGWTLLGLRMGPTHALVRSVKRMELAVGRRAHAHLCVSRCMAARLEELGVRSARVLHDGAHRRFRPAQSDPDPSEGAIVVCPMGWTADDDIGLLVDALRRYDQMAHAPDGEALPALRVILSGTGPLRPNWETSLHALKLERVGVRTLFVPADAYPGLLASSHVGLSLHRSSSGVDLPMKVVEMHAVGLPVLALDYGPCLSEILRDGEDGLLFRSADDLARCLAELLAGFPDQTPLLDRLTGGARSYARVAWHDAWREVALPAFEGPS